MPHFDKPTLELLANSKILGVRAGTSHRFTGVWVVVIERRTFVRSWNDKPAGWFRAFRREPLGAIRLDKREIAVRAKHVRSKRLQKAVADAYAAKYPTNASKIWVTGFAEPARLATTLELVPERE